LSKNFLLVGNVLTKLDNTFCPIVTSCVAAFDALVSLQPILSLNKNGWLPWQQGSSKKKFTWHHCIAPSRK